MVGQMQCFEVFRVPWEELLRHVFEVYLVHDHIELVQLGKNRHFQLPTPSAISTDQFDIIVDRSVVFNEELIVLFILCKLFDNALSESCVLELFAKKLVSKSSEETISIAECFLNPEAFQGQLFLKLDQVLYLFAVYSSWTINFVFTV